MKIRGKPPLHGGAAFGVAWKELMPSLKNAWNSEAYNEDLRANRKVYEKSAAALAAADDSEPVPPLRLRAVLLDISSRINTLLGSVTGATSEIDNNMNNRDPAEVNLSEMSTEWNDLVAYLNPLVIGPVNVGMNDEDTNQLHSLVTNQLLQPLMMLQEKAYSYERFGGQLVNREVILSDDIARNIMLQVKDKYYKAVPYGEERRAGPGMGPRPYDDGEDERQFEGPAAYVPGIDEGDAMVDWREPYEDQGPGPYGFQNPRRQGREMPNQPGELRFPEGFARRPIRMEGREGFGDYERGPLPEQDDPNIRLANARERMRGRLAERRQQDADVREIYVDEEEEPYGVPERAGPAPRLENPETAAKWMRLAERYQQRLDRLGDEQAAQVKAKRRKMMEAWQRVISGAQQEVVKNRDLVRLNSTTKAFMKQVEKANREMDDYDAKKIAQQMISLPTPRMEMSRNWGRLAGFDADAPDNSTETEKMETPPPRQRPTPQRLVMPPTSSPKEMAQQGREMMRGKTPTRERPTTPARALTPAPAQSASDVKRRVDEEKMRSKTPKRGMLRGMMDRASNVGNWFLGRNLMEEQPRAVVPFASPLDPKPKKTKEKRAQTPQPPPAAAKRQSKAAPKLTYDSKGRQVASGRWTDYSGPMPKQGRSYGSGVAGAKESKTPRGSENDPLYFHDDDNDVCETGEGSRPDEMINTEIREAHLDPDWKGLPKRWGQERRYKKLRKGYGMPKENY